MTTFPWSEEVAELQRGAALKRTRGDALRQRKMNDEAKVEYDAGIGLLDRALDKLKQVNAEPGSEEELSRARELVEVHGTRAGLLRRLGDSKAALDGYRAGADLERSLAPESTYNRTNEIKYGLLTGTTMADLSTKIDVLEQQITQSLNENPDLGDTGWAWADLGDLRALRGDGDGAERAYRAFIAKAKPTAPRTTLDVLKSILKVLDREKDPRAATVSQTLNFVQSRLNLR
jgi:tetratricopeptide (TPR) repeat protein